MTYAPVDPKKVRADASKIKSALCQYGAISTIVPATPAFNNYIGGVFKEPGVTYWDNNAHAVVLVGWDDEKKAWLLRNSWGVGWGEAGYMWVDYETYAAADERYRGNEYWVVAAPGDGGSKGHGSTLGAWYTRAPRIENTTGQALTLKVQYAGWTGVDGMRWLPQANAWYSYSIPAGFKGELASPFIGALRASKIRLHATTADGQQEWVEHKETPIDLVPEGGYWAEAAETFDIKIGSDAIFPAASPMSVADASESSTNCTSFNISRIAYSASAEYEWDEGTAPDILLELKFDKTSLRSPVGLDSYDHVWDFPTSEPLVLKPDTKITLTVFDQDLDAEQTMEALSATVPKTFPSGVWTTKGKYGALEFTGSCTGLRPSVLSASLPSSMKERGKLYFGGEATDAAGLKSITAAVSGPKGNNLALFSDTKVSGKKVALSAYAFDSENTKYAGVAGNYTIVLTATNSAGLTGSKSFHLKVELPPSLAKASLASSLNQLGTLHFGGSVSDDGALKAISAKVSGPKGDGFVLFSETLSGASKDLAAYSFNAADPRYAGVSGTYTIVLSATDDAGLVAEKSFKLAVNLPPSLSAVTLPTWVTSSEKITFGGTATDDIGLKSVKATVSGPRGEKLDLFSASSLSGTEHDLSAYTFDSADTTYAGQEGTYSVELSVSDASGLTTAKLFKVAVVSPKLTLGPVLSTGTGHTCALRKASDVICWGMGASGQLGNGASRNSNFPLPVLNLSDVVTLSAGATHTCAVKNHGEVWC